MGGMVKERARSWRFVPLSSPYIPQFISLSFPVPSLSFTIPPIPSPLLPLSFPFPSPSSPFPSPSLPLSFPSLLSFPSPYLFLHEGYIAYVTRTHESSNFSHSAPLVL
jgi:hypothetical protein